MPSANESAIPTCIRKAIIDSFSIQLGVNAEIASVSMERKGAALAAEKIECLSMIGIKSPGFDGSLALGFPASTFLKLFEKMTGEAVTEVTDQNADACGEMLNIIYASARVKINESGFEFQPAIPSTVRGKELSIAQANSSSYLKLNCNSEIGAFIVALTLKKSKN